MKTHPQKSTPAKARQVKSNPADYVPASPADFIGKANAIARLLESKAEALRTAGRGKAKLLLFGPPGVGKTRLAEYFANSIAGHATNIESINGRNVNLDIVRRWQEASRYRPLYGLFNVKIVNELDTCPAFAQDLLLTYLDEMPDCTAFIGTSNLKLDDLAERFQSRLQQFKVGAVDEADVQKLLASFRIPAAKAREIAFQCGGNVRAALLDAQSVQDAALIA